MDAKYQKIPLYFSVGFFIPAIAIRIITKTLTISSIIPCILPGIITLLLAILFSKHIGIGDGIILLTLGFFLDYNLLASSILLSLFICFIFSLFMLVIKKLPREATIPFIPFLSIGSCLSLILNQL